MRTYFFLRIRSFVISVAVFLVFLLAFDYLVEDASSVACWVALIIPLVQMQTQWYLLLPNSRKLLFVWHITEAMVESAILLLFFYFISTLPSTPSIQFPLAVLLVFVVGFLKVCFPLVNRTVGWPQSLLQSQPSFKGKVKYCAFAVVAGTVMYLIRHEPIFWIATVLAIYTSLFVLAFRHLAMPRKSLKRISFVCYGAATGLFVLWISTLVFHLFSGRPSSFLTSSALGYFQSIPISLTQDRLRELAVVGNSANYSLFNQMTDGTKASITFDEWSHRTKACKHDSCLDLSDDLLLKNLTIDERMNRFAVMASLCDFGFRNESVIRCRGPKLSEEKLEAWLKELNESKTVETWLKSSDSVQQAIAIRALTLEEVTNDQLQRIEELKRSSDGAVSRIAEIYLKDYHPPKLDQAEACKQKKFEGFCKLKSASHLF